jgi:hypothetical protein
MDAAQPAVDPDRLDAVGVPFEHVLAQLGQRHGGCREGARVAERRRSRERLDQRNELCEPLPDPGVAGEQRLLAGLVHGKELRRPARALS